MQEGQLLMTQAERDRLVALKKVKKRLISQGEAAEELGVSIRQVQRLLQALHDRGDKAVVHGLRGQASNRRIEEKSQREAVKILSSPVYEGFGPTLAAEYLGQEHGIQASKETVRKWMMAAKLWRGKKATVKQVHSWRPQRSRFGELVQWDTSEHDWLEGRGAKLYLIAMIDDATSRLFARWVCQAVCVNGSSFPCAAGDSGRWKSGNPGFGFPVFHGSQRFFLAFAYPVIEKAFSFFSSTPPRRHCAGADPCHDPDFHPRSCQRVLRDPVAEQNCKSL
jgi:transposase